MTVRDVPVNGIRLRVVDEGKGPLVLLLHGFPQTSYAWRKQIPALARSFRVVAPDLRGYGGSERPPRVADYRTTALVGDVVGLIHALGEKRAHVVGHDWGGGIAWTTAQRYPVIVDRLAVLNCPHPARFERSLRALSPQLLRSWYVFFFQLPLIPEWALLRDGAEPVARMLRRTALRSDTFTEDDLLEYRRAFSLPGAATAALSYYRALFRDAATGRTRDPRAPIASPTLLIWAQNDVALGNELTYDMDDLFTGPFRIEYVPNTSHWVMEERPALVNRLLLEFLAG